MARKELPAVDPQETAALEVLLAQVKTSEQLAVNRAHTQRIRHSRGG